MEGYFSKIMELYLSITQLEILCKVQMALYANRYINSIRAKEHTTKPMSFAPPVVSNISIKTESLM